MVAASRAAAVAAALAAGLALGEASADSEDAEPRAFWETIIHPDERRIDALVQRAGELAGQDRADARAEARALLAEALELSPDAPRPRWELARLSERDGDPEACARHLTHLARIQPDYQPPHSVREEPLLLDLQLAECLGASHRFAAAADRLRRILARGVTSEARVHGWLAQLEMARGRLRAASYALRQARRLRPHSSELRFVAAVLHDRAGRPAAARRTLRAALGRDPRLRSVRSPAGRFFPAADEHYLLGLAFSAQDEPHRAVYHLRRYLAESPVRLWDDRAQEHIREVVGEELPLALKLSGFASVDESAVRAAFEAARPALEACVRPTPRALYRARLTALSPGAPGARDGPPPGPRVIVEDAFQTDRETLEAAVACAEGVLRTLDLPRPRGRAGQYAAVEIPLLAP